MKLARLNETLHKRERVCLTEYNGKKCVLREYYTKDIANHHVSICKELEKFGFLPRILHKEGRLVYFEFISGRDCERGDALRVASRVGEICAHINQLRKRGENKQEKLIYYAVKRLREKDFLNEELVKRLINKYNLLERKLKPKIAMDLNDVHPGNFRLNNGKVYLIDIEGIYPMYKGRAIGKAFVRWFRTKEQREKFREGYEHVASMNFATDEYLDFMYLNFLVWRLNGSLKIGKKIDEKDKEYLIRLIKK
ncbi:MAG: hypothetical protein KGH55_03415 [Nanoarchaeota archaeon]|nr:hypothetical protein [Nanoarchaeota archaeon]